MASGASSGNQLGEGRPADNDLAGVSRPKARDAGVVEEHHKRPMCGQHHGAPNRDDDRQIPRNQRCLCPLAGTELDRCISQDQIDKHPGQESDGLGQTGRVEDPVDDFPGDVRAAADRNVRLGEREVLHRPS